MDRLLLSIERVNSKFLNEKKIYDVKDESRGVRLKCKIIQQTDFLFIFKPIEVLKELDKRVICISKVSWFINQSLAKELY